ncbi:TPA: type II secretion system F family protein [Candidatus Woesearchaeota archaeon]|nr:type II secretion system F family protein [Candidatus Woesearchaeota archaeon]HIH32205.1 type II secretion system F family protein [Candidatus Woesearchaeota archaeon]HIH55593.1 type II secretion system F family protein [Candidatus Woesearchaeota archaeon]HIJ02564.1 type II secretion system F family protein [Candidatus Woesearchaeota archaeon]HIJ13389.1 type II secretion system F family protein [Candidatus Woesearchaeota archaeon]
MQLYKTIAKRYPELKAVLMRANMAMNPEEYVKETVFSAVFASLALVFIIFMFTKSFYVFLFFPILVVVLFFYMVNRAYFRIKKLEKMIAREVVFAGRFLIIELESGIPLYNTFENIGFNYRYVGIYFSDIVEKVRLGTSIDDAINDTIEICPSDNLRKLLWQVLNSINTGANIGSALNSVLENIVREQNIAMKEFGNKLNPMAMFYMMIAVIIPSLGVTMLIVFSSFMNIHISLLILIILALAIGFMQFMFLMMIKNSRPNVDF